MKKKKIICFDLDNVICFTKKNFYKDSVPNIKIINLINNLYKKNYLIKIFTARYMGRFKENIRLAKKSGLNFTKNQLKLWGVNYHKLYFGKPNFDIYIDDKNLEFSIKNWDLKLKKKLRIK